MENVSLGNIIKLAIFDLIVAVADIFVFSPGFAGINPTAISDGKRISFFIIIAVELVVVLGVNLLLLLGTPKKMKIVDSDDLKQPKDYIRSLEDYLYKKEFSEDIKVLIGQINRIMPKQAGLEVILKGNFDPDQITYIKFDDIIKNAVRVFYDNTKKAINRIGVFDVDEYRKLQRGELNLPEDSKAFKENIYKEHLKYVKNIIQRNEDIITKLDELMLEISKLDDISEESMEHSQVLGELEDLIKNTKYYN